MTFTTLIAAVASMSAASIAPDMGANTHAIASSSSVVAASADFLAGGTGITSDWGVLYKRAPEGRIAPLRLREERAPKLRDAFKVKRGGLEFALRVFKPKSFKDPSVVKGVRRIYSYRRDMRAFGAAMPGHPQPPKAVVAVNVSF